MQYYQYSVDCRTRLAVTDGETTYDLTSAKPSLRRFEDLLTAAEVTETAIDQVSGGLFDDADTLDRDAVMADATVPVDAAEVWAAGVTYQISEEARKEESDMPDMYLHVYDSDRPEIFFKATPNRVVGPGEAVGIRGDSDWNVPEPELGIVLYQGDVVGYTIGNDMSSRSIEGENPLFLPQAKVYDRCCALGPGVTSAQSADPDDLEMSMRISRDGEVCYEESTSTSEMVRSVDELVSYYTRHNDVPDLSVLLTGTSLVPDDDFTLQAGDEISIDIEDIGTLSNDVTIV